MAKLSVQLTPRGDTGETTFFLRNEGEGFFLIEESADGKRYELEKDEITNVFSIKDKNAFEDSADLIDELMAGLSEEWIETLSQGLEADSEAEPTAQKPGYGPKDIVVTPENFSLDDLIKMVDVGDIEIAPRFQRHFVWDRTRQSRLIESIFLGLPLPAIYLSEYDDGRMTIVDGLQRISTIRAFVNNEFRLCNMEYFTDCNGLNFSELNLPPLQMRRFYRTQITCFKIDYRSPNQLKYDLFKRLNTGGKALNDQEIRNCLSRDKVQDTLYGMISSDEFIRATGGSIKDTRMAAQESALRFICFYDQFIRDTSLSGYDGNMSRALDSCVELLNEKSKSELDKYVTLFRDSMGLAYSLFGKYAFRKVYSNYTSSRKYAINKSLMLAITVLLAANGDIYRNRISGLCLTDGMAHLLEDDKMLNDAISWSTSSKRNILYVFECMKKLLDNNILSDNEND